MLSTPYKGVMIFQFSHTALPKRSRVRERIGYAWGVGHTPNPHPIKVKTKVKLAWKSSEIHQCACNVTQ